PEPELARVLRDAVDAEPTPDLVEEHVAGLHDRPVQVHAAVATLLPAPEEVIPERDAAGAGDPGKRRDDALLEGAGRDGHLERGAGWELALHGAVGERMLAVLDERAPLGAPYAAREEVGIVRRVRDHREDLAVPRVERHDRAVGLPEGPVGGLLEVAVD